MVLSFFPFPPGWIGFASFQCQARWEVKQPLCAHAQDPDPPSAHGRARVCPPSLFLTTSQAAGESPASSRPTAPLQPQGASSSAAQPLIIKGILFFAALLPKRSWCLTQFVSHTPAVILFFVPLPVLLFIQGSPCLLFCSSCCSGVSGPPSLRAGSL